MLYVNLFKKTHALGWSQYRDENSAPTSPLADDIGNVSWESQERKEQNVLFNDTLNTFYLWLYGIRHMVKDHSDSERGNPLLHMDYSFRLGFFYMHHPTDRIALEHWLEQEIAQWEATAYNYIQNVQAMLCAVS